MNISRLMTQLFGQNRTPETRTLELKPGEVVSGVVVQLLEGREAIVKVGDHLVRARLELDIPQGQRTLLQVQPETMNGQIVLKPLTASGVPIAETSLAELLSRFGLQDTPGNRLLLQELHSAGVPLTRDRVLRYAQMAEQVPPKADGNMWRQAALLAEIRGLPMTVYTVSALHEALFGRPLGEGLNRLGAQIQGAIREAPLPLQQLLQRIEAVLADLQRAIGSWGRSAGDGSLNASGASGIGHESNPLAPMSRQAEGALAVSTSLGNQRLPEGAVASPPTGQAPPPSPEAGSTSPAGQGRLLQAADADLAGSQARQNPVGQPMGREGFSVGGTGTESGATRNLGQAQAGSSQGAMTVQAGSDPSGTALAAQPHGGVANGMAAQRAGSSLVSGMAAADSLSAGSAHTPPEPGRNGAWLPSSEQAANQGIETARGDRESGNWISRLLRTLGIGHERQAVNILSESGLQPEAGRPEGESVLSKPADTLKGLLLQLARSEEAPFALRETAQQLVNQITGQQLLLTVDRNATFTHLALLIPVQVGQQEQTATVHVQTRKSRNGKLDTSNCRLLFDLHMQSLGLLLLDVQVTDRIVSMKVHNDHPSIDKLLDDHRDEVADNLQQLGYQLLSLRSAPYPAPAPRQVGGESAGKPEGTGGGRLSGLYVTKPYKGMDLRI